MVAYQDAAMIAYTDSPTGIEPRHLHGFFVGGPRPLSPETHLRLLCGSDVVVLVIDTHTDQVVGFITALTDGVLIACIPLLEVLPAYQGRGIGQALMRQLLDRLGNVPNVDLMCDTEVVPFYEKFGMQRIGGTALRRSMDLPVGPPPRP